MDETAFEAFTNLERSGRRREAKVALERFIASLGDASESNAWAQRFLESQNFFTRFGEFRYRVRQELFDNVLWPFLWAGAQNDNANCLYWLAGLTENCLARINIRHKNPEQAQQISADDTATSVDRIRLLKRAFHINSNAIHVRRALLTCLVDQFRYAAHEWPIGILFDANGADLESIQKIESELELARGLATEHNEIEFLSDFSLKINIYKNRIR